MGRSYINIDIVCFSLRSRRVTGSPRALATSSCNGYDALIGVDIRCEPNYHHSIMRTTIDIDAPILREVKALQKKQGRSMSRIVTELLADALSRRKGRAPTQDFRWTSRPMRALVDLADKEAVYRALDSDGR
jgi:hypothetical protein